MSTQVEEQDQKIVVRTFDISPTIEGEGRTVEGLVIPYGKSSLVNDHDGSPSYEEEWVKGAFRTNVKAPNRVLVNFEHYGARYDDVVVSGGSIGGALGHGVELEERDDGLHGKFRILNDADGDKALELIKAKVITSFSVAAKPLRSTRSISGTVQRIKAHLDWVSLARVGAFEEAQIMAVRTALPEDEQLPNFDPELAKRFALRELNVAADYLPKEDDEEEEDPAEA